MHNLIHNHFPTVQFTLLTPITHLANICTSRVVAFENIKNLSIKTYMENKILVATWGYSMTLTTWVKVIKVSPKTILVKEVYSRSLSEEEMVAKGLKTAGFYQSYSVLHEPVAFRERNGEVQKAFRLYKRGEYWVGSPDSYGSKFYFKEWDGTPQYEDHND